MLIQCPSCDFQTNIADSKQGAKLRCPQCSRVFVARPARAAGRGAAGRRAATSSDSSRYVIGGVVAVAGVVLFMMFGRGGQEKVAAAPELPKAPEAEPDTGSPEPEGQGWDSAPVKFVRELHELVHAKNEASLLLAVDAQRAWTARGQDAAWGEQARSAQTTFEGGLVEELAHGEAGALVRDWEPFDGWIESIDGDARVVRVRVTHREDESLADRHIEWHIARTDERWKAFNWERWISPDEQDALDSEARAADRAARPKVVRKTLTDGSKVIEGKVRAIAYMDETPEADRELIDGLLTRLIDLEADDPRDWSDAKEELVTLGKPVIPPLLTFIAETPHEDHDAGSQLMRVNQTLMDITGHFTSFKPHVTLGATEERQESGLKQWFGWYDRKFKRFEGAPEVADPLDPLGSSGSSDEGE